MVVQHNMTAMNANRYFGMNNSKLSKSLEKLSSGYAINRAGDNAAGLAVSEKMRAQISGLTQAAKNAQDGISMTQTFEGALTETDSILQRMRSLAVQSANGSYDNSVDRAAIQLEYDQLNDELDQIADTDYNGVVVLNGGTMADGAKATSTGLIDYANQPERAAAQWNSSDINTLDTSKYTGTKPADVWTDLGLTSDTESVDVTFKYDKDADTWSVSDTSAGATVTAAAKTNLTTTTTASTTAGKNNGGFAIKNATTHTSEVANVVLDSTKLVNGDTITLTFTNPKIKNTAPENIAISEGTLETTLKDADAKIASPTFTVNGGGGAATNYVSTNLATGKVAMTKEAAASFNGLNGASFEITYATADKVTGIKMTLADGTSKTLATTADANTGSITSADGVAYSLSALKDTGVLTISDAAGKELMKLTPGTLTPGASDSAGNKQSFSISLDKAIYEETTEPEVSIKDSEDNSVSKSNYYNQSTAKLTYTNEIALQVGARSKDLVNFTMAYSTDGIGELKDDLNCTSNGLGTKELSLATQEDANKAIDKIDNAINKVSMVRGTFGALQNRLEHKIDNLNTTNENLTAAESRIRDTNMAEEMMNFTKNQILSQASQSMLAQANQLPQGVLSLLQ